MLEAESDVPKYSAHLVPFDLLTYLNWKVNVLNLSYRRLRDPSVCAIERLGASETPACRTSVSIPFRLRYIPAPLFRSVLMFQYDRNLLQWRQVVLSEKQKQEITITLWAYNFEGIFENSKFFFFFIIKYISYLYLLKGYLEGEWFVVIRIKGALLDRRFLLLQSLSILHQRDFNVRIRKATDVHLFQILGFQNDYRELASRWDVSQWEAYISQFVILRMIKQFCWKLSTTIEIADASQ